MFKTYGFIFPECVYCCPVCQVRHNSYEAAAECIKSHAKPEKLVGFDSFDPACNAASRVFVEFDDGRVGEYRLLGVLATHPAKAEEAQP